MQSIFQKNTHRLIFSTQAIILKFSTNYRYFQFSIRDITPDRVVFITLTEVIWLYYVISQLHIVSFINNKSVRKYLENIHVFFIRKSLFCLSLNFLNISRNWAWDFLKFSKLYWNKLVKMVYTFVIATVYLNLISIFNILNAITTKYRFLAYENTYFWKLSLVIFLRFWRFELHILVNFFLIKKTCSCCQ